MNRRLTNITDALAAVVAVAGLTAGPAAAGTSPPNATLYAVTGTTHIRKANADMTLGPGGLVTPNPWPVTLDSGP